MTEVDASQFLLQGKDAWNAWRDQNPCEVSFRQPHWYDSPGRGGKQRKGRNRLDFSGMNFYNIRIYKAFAEGLNLRNSVFCGTIFEEGDFSRADFSGAILRDTRFNKTILTGANFDGATIVNCNLNRVNLAEAEFCVREISDTVVYGVSTWDLMTSDGMKQSNLVIEKTYDLYSDLIAQEKIPMTVDNIELAQFVYYLTNHKKMRDVLNVLNEKGVLLLGQFKDGGLDRLYAVRNWLRRKRYMAMIFDFERPDSLSLTETVNTMAGLSKFIFADLSGSSVPHELAKILSENKKPVIAFGKPYSMTVDLGDQTPVLSIGDQESKLLQKLELVLPKIDKLHAKRTTELGKRDKRGGRQRRA